MRKFCLTMARLAVPAWVGAASLFVMTTLAEVRSPDLDSIAKSHLAVLRFPLYYLFAFTLLVTALVCFTLAAGSVPPVRRRVALSLLAAAVVLTTVDYFWIYQALIGMTSSIDQARTADFIDYHQASKWINSAQVTVSAVAALLVCCPASTRSIQDPRNTQRSSSPSES